MKRAYIKVTPDVIGTLLKQTSAGECLVVRSAIPEDAVFISAHFEPQSSSFIVVFEHDSFEDVLEGCVMPCLHRTEFTYHPGYANLTSRCENLQALVFEKEREIDNLKEFKATL